MPLDAGDILYALTHPGEKRGDTTLFAPAQLRLAKILRAELQSAGQNTSGKLDTLARRLVDGGLATKHLFARIRDEGLLTQAQPLRKCLEDNLPRPQI